MCRVLAYIGQDIPVSSLLLDPENSLVNQTLDPELHPQLQLAGWGFGAWSEHLLKPEEPLLYHRPMAAFYDNNADSLIPSLQASTLLAHVRASDYTSDTVLVDENCHPFSYKGTPWIIAQNGALPNWRILQRELLSHCKDEFLEQMRGSTDTEFLYVLLLSLLKGNTDEEVQQGFEDMLKIIIAAMKKLDLVELTKLKVALVSPDRIIGVNSGSGHDGETDVKGDWKELLASGSGKDDHALAMLLEPMYLLAGKNFDHYETSYDIDACPIEEATSVIFASEALTEDDSDWTNIEFGEIVFLEKKDSKLTMKKNRLNV